MKNGIMAIVLTVVVALGMALPTTMQAAEKKAAAINTKCPMSGKAVKNSKTSDIKVDFCCDKCKGKFEKDVTKHLSKVGGEDPGKCIFSGRAAKTSSTVTVAFCCGNCKGKFDADPAKYVGKIKG